MRNVSIQQSDGKPDIAFSSDGTLKSVELKIMNLRPDGRSNQPNQEQNLIWEEVSTTNLISHKKSHKNHEFSFSLKINRKTFMFLFITLNDLGT